MNEQKQQRGLIAPLHYLVIGILGATFGLFIVSETGGMRGGGLFGLILVIAGITFVFTGLIRGATRGWLSREIR